MTLLLYDDDKRMTIVRFVWKYQSQRRHHLGRRHFRDPIHWQQVVTKRCRLNKSALVHEPKCGGGGYGVSANEYSCAHGAQINFGDPIPYFNLDWWWLRAPQPPRLLQIQQCDKAPIDFPDFFSFNEQIAHCLLAQVDSVSQQYWRWTMTYK